MNNNLIFNNISTDNNMGVVRYLLCLTVIAIHFNSLTGVLNNFPEGADIVVGGFFALSGFLLFASFQRAPATGHYIDRRARRILPPYCLVIIVCAIGLVGTSELGRHDYYTNKGFWQYLVANLSCLNFLQPQLPGVFQTPEFHSHAVNGSLWTMKCEWVCSFSIPIIYRIIRGSRRRAKWTLISLVIISIALRYIFYSLEQSSGDRFYGLIAKQFGSLLVFFFGGAIVNLYFKEFLKYKWPILIIALLLILTADYNPLYHTLFRPYVGTVIPLWVSMVGKWATFLKNHDDKSYDMYLFHFPIIQLAVYFGLPAKMPAAALFVLIVVVTFIVAWLSATFIGSRFYRRSRN